jgi:hypothetical protein
MPSREPSQRAAEAVEAWIVAGLPWLGAALLLAVCAGVVGVFLIVRRTQLLDQLALRLDALEDLRAAVARLAAARDDLDVRRIEHVLLEIRDGQRRVEDRLLRTMETARAGSGGATGGATGPAGSAVAIGERVTDRLLALGYERVQIVTLGDELPTGADVDAEVRVEAFRNGVLCKGRALVSRGALVDVEMKPAYTTFP